MPIGDPEVSVFESRPRTSSAWVWAIEHIGYPATISLAIVFVMYLLVGKVSDQLESIEKAELQIQTTLNDWERLFIDIQSSVNQVHASVEEHGSSSTLRDQGTNAAMQTILADEQTILRRLDDIYHDGNYQKRRSGAWSDDINDNGSGTPRGDIHSGLKGKR